MSASPAPIDRRALIAQARSYLGTPFAHNGRLPGVGLDCLGVLLALAHDCALGDIVVPSYGTQPDPVLLRAETRRHMDEIGFDALAPADVLTFDIAHREQHYALVTELAPHRILHAYSPAGRVLEIALDTVWRRRIRGCWRFRALPPWQS